MRAPADMTRARAFDWIGNKHWIPALAGAQWIGEDLDRVLEKLERGGEVTLDYRGAVPEAPQLLLARSDDDVMSLKSVTGTLDDPGNTRCTWPPSDLPDRLTRIRFDIMRVLVQRRGRSGVVPIPPQAPVE